MNPSYTLDDTDVVASEPGEEDERPPSMQPFRAVAQPHGRRTATVAASQYRPKLRDGGDYAVGNPGAQRTVAIPHRAK